MGTLFFNLSFYFVYKSTNIFMCSLLYYNVRNIILCQTHLLLGAFYFAFGLLLVILERKRSLHNIHTGPLLADFRPLWLVTDFELRVTLSLKRQPQVAFIRQRRTSATFLSLRPPLTVFCPPQLVLATNTGNWSHIPRYTHLLRW